MTGSTLLARSLALQKTPHASLKTPDALGVWTDVASRPTHSTRQSNGDHELCILVRIASGEPGHFEAAHCRFTTSIIALGSYESVSRESGIAAVFSQLYEVRDHMYSTAYGVLGHTLMYLSAYACM
jgi:hypothetical protein